MRKPINFTGHYLTPAPIKLAGGLNSYQYVPNPTGWVDPLGLMSVEGDCPGERTASLGEINPNSGVNRADAITPVPLIRPENFATKIKLLEHFKKTWKRA